MERVFRPATRLNNDADGDASQGLEDGKSQKLLPHCNRAEDAGDSH
jgi:hypothetical protein